MWLIILFIVLSAVLIVLGLRNKIRNPEPPANKELADIAQLDFEEKLRKYKDEYYFNNPILRNRL